MRGGAAVLVAFAWPGGATATEPLRGQWHLDAPEAFQISFDSSGNALHGSARLARCRTAGRRIACRGRVRG